MEQVHFIPTPTCEAFMQSDKYVRVLSGPIGSSKSVTCVHELIRWATDQEPNKNNIRKTRFLICRNTADQLKSTTLKTIFDWIPPSWAGSYVGVDKTFYIRFGLPDGTIVETDWMAIALDTPDDVRKALSLEATGLWGNECRELHPDVVEGLLMRVNRYPSPKDGGPTRPGAIFDTNMPQLGSWWHQKMAAPPGNWASFEQPPAVLTAEEWRKKYGLGKRRWKVYSPAIDRTRFVEASVGAEEISVQTWDADKGRDKATDMVRKSVTGEVYVVDHEADNFVNLNASYYPETLDGKTREFIDVYLRAKFGTSREGKPVYENFRRSFHVADRTLHPIRSDNHPLLIGLDFGLTPACTISQLDVRGRLLTFAELQSTGMGAQRFCREKLRPLLADRFPGFPVLLIGDPAGVQRSQNDELTVFDILEAEGFKAVAAPSNKLLHRINALENFLARAIDGAPGHLIDPSCAALIGGLAGGYYYRKKRGTDETHDAPEKNMASHLLNAHEYTALYVQQEANPLGHFTQRSARREVKAVSLAGWV